MTYVVLDHAQLRKGHNALLNKPEGFQQFEEWIASNGKAGKQSISSSQPTRIGKGEQMRSGAVCAVLGWIDRDGHQHDPIASLVILASPSDALASQVIKPNKYTSTFQRFGMDKKLMSECLVQRVNAKTDNKSWEALDDHGRIKILSVTNDMVLSRYDHFKKLCKARLQETGLPVLIWWDESHRLGDDTTTKTKADLFMEECDALSITMTATAWRRDGKTIHGFSRKTQTTSEKEITRVIGTNADNPGLVDVVEELHNETWDTQTADIEVPWKYAWENKCLCQVNVEKVKVKADVIVEKVEPDEAEMLAPLLTKPGKEGEESTVKWLHDFYDPEKENGVSNESLVRRIINLAVRDERIIREACRKGIKRLAARRKLLPATKMVVFGGNDRPDSSDNEHLEQIKRILASEWNRYFPGQPLRAMILTMKSQEADDSSVIEKLDEFENGPYDVILLKQMASEGWDTQVTKVGINLSPVRTYSNTIQSTMRVATPWEYENGKVMLRADWVALHDPYLVTFSKWLKGNQGPLSRTVEVENLDEYTREKKEGPKHETNVTIEGAGDGGSIQFGSGADLDAEATNVVLRIRYRYPEIQDKFSDSEIWQMYQRGAFQNCAPNADPEPVDDSAFEDQGQVVREVISQVQELLKSYVIKATKRCGNVKLNGSFGMAVSKLAGEVSTAHNKKHPSDDVPTKFSGITNVDVARRFLATASSTRWEAKAVEIVRRIVDIANGGTN